MKTRRPSAVSELTRTRSRAPRLKLSPSLYLALCLTLYGAVHCTPEKETPSGGLPQGVAFGEAHPGTFIFWARCAVQAHVHLSLKGTNSKTAEPPLHRSVIALKKNDFTVRMRVSGLRPGGEYSYRAWCGDENKKNPASALTGKFRTPPTLGTAAPVRFVFGGDIAGQNVCRDAREGFPILRTIRKYKPDFFIGLGDLIYADNRCEKIGRFGNEQIPRTAGKSVTLDDFRAHWKYNRSAPEYRALLGETMFYALWDDHEVTNDFGPRGRGTENRILIPRGKRAFLEFNPVHAQESFAEMGTGRMYRSFRWGKNLEFFILDNRSHRDANSMPDQNRKPKTMLGKKQLAWLLKGLAASRATWRIVVSSVPMSIPTGTNAKVMGRDGWANFKENTGFERELLKILAFARTNKIRNMVWLTTDVHFATVLRYRPFATHGDFTFHEIVTGPMSAGLYPSRDLDRTLNPERLFFHGPARPQSVKTFEQAKSWFNFGLVEVDGSGRMKIAIVNTNNKKLYELKLNPR